MAPDRIGSSLAESYPHWVSTCRHRRGLQSNKSTAHSTLLHLIVIQSTTMIGYATVNLPRRISLAAVRFHLTPLRARSISQLQTSGRGVHPASARPLLPAKRQASHSAKLPNSILRTLRLLISYGSTSKAFLSHGLSALITARLSCTLNPSSAGASRGMAQIPRGGGRSVAQLSRSQSPLIAHR